MQSKDSIKTLRDIHLSPSFSLSYNEPLHIVKGEGQYLYDADGNQYLDAVNNIQHVGHCHPKIVEAVQKQAATLDYATAFQLGHPTIFEMADKLVNMAPDGITHVFFSNSGSHGNNRF